MVVNQQFTYEDDLNEYNVGDVIRFWNDEIIDKLKDNLEVNKLDYKD